MVGGAAAGWAGGADAKAVYGSTRYHFLVCPGTPSKAWLSTVQVACSNLWTVDFPSALGALSRPYPASLPASTPVATLHELTATATSERPPSLPLYHRPCCPSASASASACAHTWVRLAQTPRNKRHATTRSLHHKAGAFSQDQDPKTSPRSHPNEPAWRLTAIVTASNQGSTPVPDPGDRAGRLTQRCGALQQRKQT